jgi:exopolyphosphatase/guanosine-5'-triphosphate,3'-diphosphate pyrophosphatase
MVVAEERQGQLFIVDRIREMVRLAAGLDSKGKLSPQVAQTALECLQRFGQRLRDLDSESVSAVGTNTLRRTRNADDFLQQAEAMLGHSIEIISGIEEARLVYQGVAHTLEPDHRDKLVIDIGGGSTELIIGQDFEPRLMESLEMGCVTMTRSFFPDGKITPRRVNKARIRVLQKMKPIRHAFRHQGWAVVIGASGTNRAAAAVVQALGLTQQDGVSFAALQELIRRMQKFDSIDAIRLEGLSERRVPVFLGGVIVLAGVFEALGIEQMQVSEGALRDGLLYDMLGRRHNRDIRNQTMQQLASRFHVDLPHARRVEQTACRFLDQVFQSWGIYLSAAQRLLIWASEIHEIGRDIAHSAYQKHSAYIIENADLAGFSQQEKRRLGVLVRAHRGKLSDKLFSNLARPRQSPVIKLAVLLRLAVIFHRSRVDTELPHIALHGKEQGLDLHIPADWLEQHPLTLNDLEQEAEYLRAIKFDLTVTAQDMAIHH